jgi:hypothetical protein
MARITPASENVCRVTFTLTRLDESRPRRPGRPPEAENGEAEPGSAIELVYLKKMPDADSSRESGLRKKT